MRKSSVLLFVVFVLLSCIVRAETRSFGQGLIEITGNFQQGTLLEGAIALEVAIALDDSKMLESTKMSEGTKRLEGSGSPKGTNIQQKFKQGSEAITSTDHGIKLLLNGESVRITPNGRFVIGFGRDAALTNSLELLKEEQRILLSEVKLDKREYPTQSITGVPQQTVTPSKDKLARIRNETAMVKAARKSDSNNLAFLSRFKAPMDSQITGVYGSQRIYNGTPKRPHFGVDYAGPIGAPVYAPADGTVTLVHPDMYYSGGTLIIDHGYGVSSTFIHLSKVVVNEGDLIRQGDKIAEVGSGGRSTGPHLDWRVNWYQERIDPLLVLEKHK